MKKEFMKTKDFARKRMMFIQKEDYNFLIYNTLLILDTLECNSESKQFSDFRKIAYLVDIISSSKNLNDLTQNELTSIYSKAQLKKKLLSHVLVVLKNNQMLGITLNRTRQTFDIWIKKENIPNGFLNELIFKKEKENILQVKKSVGSLTKSTIKTMVEKLFTSKNIMTWEI
jgi:hypothetical protein